MLKNSKLLKGIVISLAFVLVLGGAFLLKQWADANEKVVVFYVDDRGDNTTGSDIASAYNSIGAATEAAAKMGLAPGTEVRILIGEQVTLTTQSIDVNVVTDANGDKLPVVVTSLNSDDPSNFAVIYHAYRQQEAVPTNPSQRARIINNLTLKNIVLKSKVHEVYVANNNTGKQTDLYRVRTLYVDGNDVVFDNVKFTTDLGDKINNSNTWTVYCDNCTPSEEKGDPTVTFKNGDYTNVYIYGHAAIMPNYDITLNVENSQLGSVYVIANSDKTENKNCNSLKASFKDSSIKIFNFANGGDYTIPKGLEITFDGTTVDDYRVKTDKRESETLRGDLTFNFKGDTYVYNTDTLYLAPIKELKGNLTTNFSGGTYPISVFPAGYRTTITGNITNNISGGEFKKFFCASSRCGYVGGNITNNISGSPIFVGRFIGGTGAKAKVDDIHVELDSITNNISGTPTFKAAYCGGSLDGTIGTIKNNIKGVPTFEANFFGGGGDGTTIKDKTTGEVTFSSFPTIGKIENDINGGLFMASYYGGSQSGESGDINNNIYGDNTVQDVIIGYYFGSGSANNKVCGNVENKLKRTIIDKSYYAGGDTILVGDITTILDDDVTVKNNYYGGSYGTNEATCGNIVNKFIGKNIQMNSKEKGNFVGGLRVANGTCGSIKNLIEASAEVTFGLKDNSNYYYGGNADGTCGNVENYIKAPAVIHATYCGGNKAGKVQNIYNEFSGGVHFMSWVYASSAGADYTKDTINYVTNATFEKFMCGGPINKTGENVLNHITSDKVVFKQSYFGGTYAKGSGVKSVTNYIADGVKFEGKLDTQCVWLGGKEGTTEGKTLNIISGVEFYGKVICGRNDGNCGDIYNEFTDCKIIKTTEEKNNKTTTYGGNFIGGCQGTVKAEGPKTAQCGNIINNIKDTEIGSYYYAGSTSDDAVVGDLTNHLSGVTFGDMYVGGSPAGKVGNIVNNLISGNVFKGSFYGGSYGSKEDQKRIAATVAGDIYNYISGANFEKMYYGGNYNGTCGNVHNYILTEASFKGEFFGAGRLGVCEDVENIFFENATLAADYYGGGEEGARVGNVQSILANGAFKAYIVGGNKKDGNIASIETTFYNNATHEGYYYGGNRGGNAVVGSITNNIYTGNFMKWFVGGSTSGTCGDITNNVMGDITFNQSFYGGTHGNGTIGGKVVNNIYNAKFVGTNPNAYNVWLGGSYGTAEIVETIDDKTYVSLNHPTVGDVTNTLVGVTFKCKVYGGMRYGVTGNIENNISSCTFEKEFAAGCHAGQTGDITTNVDSNTLFGDTYYGGNRQAKYPDDIIKSDTQKKYSEKGWTVTYMDSVAGNITNNVYSGTFVLYFCAGSFVGTSESVENNIYSNEAIFKFQYFGGPYDGSASVKEIYNNIYGGVFTNTVNLAGRNAKTFEKVYSVISGGTFKGEEPVSANFAYAEKSGDITLVINPDESKIPLVFAGKGLKNGDQDTIILKGSDKAVQLSLLEGATVSVDSLEPGNKNVIFFNNSAWNPEQIYVVMPDTLTTEVLSKIVLQSKSEESNLAEIFLKDTNYVVKGKTIEE